MHEDSRRLVRQIVGVFGEGSMCGFRDCWMDKVSVSPEDDCWHVKRNGGIPFHSWSEGEVVIMIEVYEAREKNLKAFPADAAEVSVDDRNQLNRILEKIVTQRARGDPKKAHVT